MALLQESTGQKLRFLSHVSHEIRTPISAVMGLAELVLDDPEGLSAENRQALGLIRKSAVELSTLVNDLLDVAKLEAGRFEVRPERFLLEEVVGAMRGTFRVLHTSEHVALRLGPVDAIPALFTDRGKVAQIVRNLVSNALKFTERGEVALDARLVGETWVEVLVSDTGLGIEPAEHERVFEEFTQAHNHLQARAGGTGLGLLISRRLARLLGGDLTLRASGAGLGSTFALLLPLAYPGAEGAEVAPAGSPLEANAWRAKVAGEGPLLVIDDDASWRRSLRQQLATLGRATVVEAADGERGLALARELSPDAIVLDFDLPGRDGLAVLRDLRADPATRSIPVVLHTAKHFSSAERRELLTAAVDVLSKDEDAEAWSSALARALADALARRRDAEGRPEQVPSRGESSS
jgi:CheY-like chemotaxis protein